MKKAFVFLLFLGIGFNAFSQASICAIIDYEGKALEKARVYVKSDIGIESFYLTDSLGIAVINGLDAGQYDLYISNADKTVSGVYSSIVLGVGSFYIDSFSLKDDEENKFKRKNGKWLKVKEEKKSKERLITALGRSSDYRSSEKSMAAPVEYSEVEMYDTYDEAPPMTAKLSSEEVMTAIPEPEPVGEVPDLRAGLLTASEWSDLKNWDLWSDQVEEEFLEYAETWNLAPKYRTSIHLKNQENEKLVHALVEVVDKLGNVLARGRTDNQGVSELFSDQSLQGKKDFRISYRGKSFILDNEEISSDMSLVLDTNCNNSNVVEIMFVVDATGSMGDEINYLKKEVQDVINRISDLDQDKEVRSGAIFYRDHTDQYLSRRKELSSDVSSLNTFIQEQYARGGGDFPEALDYALEELTTSINWSSDAITKIAFLILDAPPHEDEASVQRIKESVVRAAEQGIRLIPVTGSGIDKSTEYLMKAISISTNGTYLYLTDDSGIGGKHLEASNDKTEVEFLNDLMVRIVEEMVEVDCFNSEDRGDGDIINDWEDIIGMNIYPNPVQDILNVDLEADMDKIQILDLKGRIVKDFGKQVAGIHQFDVSNLEAGTYFVLFNYEGKSYSLKLVCAK